jgi:hypothetical protein
MQADHLTLQLPQTREWSRSGQLASSPHADSAGAGGGRGGGGSA